MTTDTTVTAQALQLTWRKWHPSGDHAISIALERLYSPQQLPEIPADYRMKKMFHEDRDRSGVVALRHLYMPAYEDGTIIFPLLDSSFAEVGARIQFKRSSGDGRYHFMVAGRFPSDDRPELSAFGFDANDGKSKHQDYLPLAFPGIDGAFAPVFLRVASLGEKMPRYLKISAKVFTDRKVARVECVAVGEDEVPEILRVAKLKK
jgi:hypothetical protein